MSVNYFGKTKTYCCMDGGTLEVQVQVQVQVQV